MQHPGRVCRLIDMWTSEAGRREVTEHVSGVKGWVGHCLSLKTRAVLEVSMAACLQMCAEGSLTCTRSPGAGFYPRPLETESEVVRDEQVPLCPKKKSPLKNW